MLAGLVLPVVGFWLFCLAVGLGITRSRGKGRKLAEYELLLRQARVDAEGGTTYRQVRADEPELLALVRGIEADQAAVEACGFAEVGTFTMLRADGTPVGVSRALIDGSRMMVAYLFVVPRKPGIATLIVESYAGDDVYSTLRSAALGTLASAPTSHRKILPPKVGVRTVIEHHREHARLDEPGREFVRIADADELARVNQQRHETLARWRRAQPPDRLLDADLRGILGRHYARFGKYFTSKLRADLPKATVRRA